MTSIELIPDKYCTFEKLELYEGSTATSSSLRETYCGHVPPCPFVSRGNSVLVVLRVYDLSKFGGFSLEFREVAANYTLPNTCETGRRHF